MCPPKPLRPHRRALTTLHPLTGRAWFGRSLPDCPHLPGCPRCAWFGFSSLPVVFRGCVPNHPPPLTALTAPPPPPPQRFVRPHCPQRFAGHSTSSPPSPSLPAPAHGLCHYSPKVGYTASTSSPPSLPRSPPSLLCHYPHLAALGSVSAIVPTWLPLVRVFM